MKLKLISLLFVFTVFSAKADIAAQAPAPMGLTNLKLPVMVKPDQTEFSIRMQSNGTTGYMWFLTHYDHDLVTLEKHSYLPPQNTKLVGAPGTEVWTFKLKPEAKLAPQMSSISFTYIQPWAPPAQMTETKINWVSM